MPAIGMGPALALRSGTRPTPFDFSGGALPPGATVLRASAGSRYRADGVLASVAADQPRFDHDPATGRLRGLLVEPESRNLLAQSSGFAGAAWTRTSAVVSAAAGVAPDGTTTAAVIGDETTVGTGWISQEFVSGAAVVASLHIRKDAVPAATRIAMFRVSNPHLDLRIDTMTGAVAGDGGSYGIDDLGAYWRVWRTAAAGAATIAFFPAAATGGLTAPYATGVTGSTTIWGAQVEAGTLPSSPIATSGAPATRAADRVLLDWGRMGVADGALSMRCSFDDGSQQVIAAAVTAGVAELTAWPTRRHLVRIERA